MSLETILLVLGAFIFGLLIGILAAYRKIAANERAHQQEVFGMETRHRDMLKGSRQDAVTRSKNSMLGRLWEQTAPFLPGFKYAPNDLRFIGSPVDYVVFDGASAGDVKKVVFLEVKSAGSKLTGKEKQIKEAVLG